MADEPIITAGKRKFFTVRYDPTINLGHILTFCGFIISAAAAWFSVQTDLRIDGESIKRHDDALKQMTVDVTSVTKENRESIDGLRREVYAGFEKINDKLERIREDKKK